MGLFSKRLPEDVELWLANTAMMANLPDSDQSCRLVMPPGGGIFASAPCGSPPEAKVHQTGHPYFGPDDFFKRTCEFGHRFLAPKETPDIGCPRCKVDAKFPGWKPSGKIGAWHNVPLDQRP